MATRPVVEHEDVAVRVGRHLGHHVVEVEVETAHRRHDDEHEGGEHARGLERVGPHEGLHSGTARVEPDERDHHHDRTREGHVPSVEDEPLEDEAHHVEAHGGPHEL